MPKSQFFGFWKRQPHAINRDQRQSVVRNQIDSAVATFDGLHDIVHVARGFHYAPLLHGLAGCGGWFLAEILPHYHRLVGVKGAATRCPESHWGSVNDITARIA